MAKSEPNNLPQESVKQLLDNQTRELEIRAQETKLREKELDQNHEIAVKSLQAQEKWVNRLPNERRKDWTTLAIIGGIFSLMVAALIIYLFHIGESEAAKYILAIISSAIVSGGGGFGFGFHKGKKSNNSQEISE
ncbi:hypothetical protein [Rhodohalobacter sp.]|uniref:hypothetical protein n=1 Tax=Rhodohalobacter sp. TaxID=1974210 RepID=UPI0035619A1F